MVSCGLSKPLIIVESPAKAKTIEKFLGRRFLVKASKGHVRDLPKSQLGVDVEDGFAPKYITIRGKGTVVQELRDVAKKSSRVYLATDPDREGEAISWHLAHLLGLPADVPCRVVFHEITADAVQRAVKSPRPIDEDLVHAQQARRILDRLVGYQLSPLLWRKIRRGLSAGRVQSVAVRLIVDREKEIEAFVPEEYWSLEALINDGDLALRARFVHPEGDRGLRTKEEVDRIVQELYAANGDSTGPYLTVTKVGTKERRRLSPLPFTTSTLQQEAARKLGFAVRKTMSLAQSLYEGLEVPGEGLVGVVTYIRTDSTRIADEAQHDARAYISERYGASFAQPQQPKAKARSSVQDAHEAIRPTRVSLLPSALKATLSKDLWKLYNLIWERFVASQMSPARFEVTTVDLDGCGHLFRLTGVRPLFAGFLSVYEEGRDEDERADEQPLGRSFTQGQRLLVTEFPSQQHFTQPPPRYSEAMLVKTLEEKGIGRPSTYAPIVETIVARGYVLRENRRFRPTDLGVLVVDLLTQYFSEIVDPEFTADMETKLDSVEEGQEGWRSVLADFYVGFSQELKVADEAIGHLSPPEEESDIVCDQCGRRMVVKYGRFGKFLACPGYPECRNTKPYVEPTGAHCPLCGGDVVERRSKKGRRFYGCIKYPECSFTTWSKPVGRDCPECGAFLVARRTKEEGLVYQCVREGCGHQEYPAGEE